MAMDGVSELTKGTAVRVRDYSGQILERVVTGSNSAGVMLTSSEELEKAAQEHREPRSVGYPKEDILET
jgi:hypothetical protein